MWEACVYPWHRGMWPCFFCYCVIERNWRPSVVPNGVTHSLWAIFWRFTISPASGSDGHIGFFSTTTTSRAITLVWLFCYISFINVQVISKCLPKFALRRHWRDRMHLILLREKRENCLSGGARDHARWSSLKRLHATTGRRFMAHNNSSISQLVKTFGSNIQ